MRLKRVFIVCCIIAISIFSIPIVSNASTMVHMVQCPQCGEDCIVSYSAWYKILSYYADDSERTVMWLIARDWYCQCTANSAHNTVLTQKEKRVVPQSELSQYGL